MIQMLLLRLLTVLAMLAAAVAWPQEPPDSGRGKLLYDTLCSGCHYERVHERDPAKSGVRSYAALRAEVARWAGQTGKPISAPDQADIAEYLNRSHYRLEE
jgi:hypothetical protein